MPALFSFKIITVYHYVYALCICIVHYAYHYLAQSAEHETFNIGVVGSSPTLGANVEFVKGVFQTMNSREGGEHKNIFDFKYVALKKRTRFLSHTGKGKRSLLIHYI